MVMLGVTWFNRMLNGSTSGKWTTIFLLVVALLHQYYGWMISLLG